MSYLASSYEQIRGEEPKIDDIEIPWFIHEDGCRVESIDEDMHILWVPVLIAGPIREGRPDAPLLTDAQRRPANPRCSDHRPVQHRDGEPPWCRNCGKR